MKYSFIILLLVLISSCESESELRLIDASLKKRTQIFDSDELKELITSSSSAFDAVMFEKTLIGISSKKGLFTINSDDYANRFKEPLLIPFSKFIANFVFQNSDVALLQIKSRDNGSFIRNIQIWEVSANADAKLLLERSSPYSIFKKSFWLNSREAIIAEDSSGTILLSHYKNKIISKPYARIERAEFRDMHFVNPNNGYIVGLDGTNLYRSTLFRTLDSGKTWIKTRLPGAGSDYKKIFYSNETIHLTEKFYQGEKFSNFNRAEDYVYSRNFGNTFISKNLFSPTQIIDITGYNDQYVAIAPNGFMTRNSDNPYFHYNMMDIHISTGRGSHWNKLSENRLPGSDVKFSSDGKHLLLIHKSPSNNPSNSIIAYNFENKTWINLIYPFSYLN